jgi:hypothetical protein
MMFTTNLHSQGSQDALRVDEACITKVVQATVLEDLRTSLKPDGLSNGGAVGSQQLGGHAAQRTCKNNTKNNSQNMLLMLLDV